MGGTVWFDWFWFLSLWKKASDGCSAGLRPGVDGVSVFHAKCDGAGFDGFSLSCDSLFLSSLIDGNYYIADAINASNDGVLDRLADDLGNQLKNIPGLAIVSIACFKNTNLTGQFWPLPRALHNRQNRTAKPMHVDLRASLGVEF